MILPTREHALDLLRQMVLIRHFEEKSAELYTAQKIRGFLHLYIGEEAVAVGVMQALTPEDAVVATYREHGHALARGVSPGAVMAEMFGKQEGCSRGRGGSMHLFDKEHRLYGGGGIVGGGLPIATGLALADKMQNRRLVTCCFFGEGAVAEGTFHESMNLAALWRLPVLFVCENNFYAMGTALSLTESVTDLSLKAAAYGMASSVVDGMDVLAVEEAATKAAEEIRADGRPHFLECRTYRFRAHSMFDPEFYRAKNEVEEWKNRGPIIKLTTRLKSEGIINEEDFQAVETEAAAQVEEAIAFAEAGTWEPVEHLLKFVHSERQNHVGQNDLEEQQAQPSSQ